MKLLLRSLPLLIMLTITAALAKSPTSVTAAPTQASRAELHALQTRIAALKDTTPPPASLPRGFTATTTPRPQLH